MIRIFDERETDFSHDGIEVLDNIAISCICERELNGTWFLNAQFIRDDDKSTSIQNMRILKVPTAKGEQLFRIINIKSTKNKINVYAEHIFFDNRYNFIDDTYIVKKDGNNALQQIMAACQYSSNKFTGLSSISTVASARLVRKNLIDVLMGSDDNSFLNRWGGEIDYDNYSFTINPQIGEDRGVEVTYGHNMQDFEGEIDESGVVTRVMPKGFDGLILPEKYIDSPLINNYSFPKIQMIELSHIKVKQNPEDEEGYDTEELALQAMRDYVAELYSIHNIDKPSINLRVNIVSLEKTDQFKNEIFERMYLGDTLKINLQKYGFDVSCRIISERYDSLNSRYSEIELGDVKTSILRQVTSFKETFDNVLNEYGQNWWETLLNKAQDETKSMLEEGIKNSYVTVKKNEILIMDDEDVTKAKNVIRMNKNGIGFSQTGYEGPYVIGITIDGKINASCITTGTLNAELIKAGRLQSLNQKTWIDMESGAFSLADGRITFDSSTGLNIKLSNDSELEQALEALDSALKVDINDVANSVSTLQNTMNTSFKDGIIDEAEYIAILESLNRVDTEKLDIEKNYTSLYSNIFLEEAKKGTLKTKYDNYISSHTNLINYINNTIGDRVATDEEKTEIDNLLSIYSTKLSEYSVAQTESINNIAQNSASSILDEYRDLVDKDIQDINTKLGQIETDVDNIISDGIVDEAEKLIIENSIKELDKEKLDLNTRYTQLNSNSLLSSATKTTLGNNFTAYSTAHTNLTTYINDMIKDGAISDTEKTTYATKISAYNTALSTLTKTFDICINEISSNNTSAVTEALRSELQSNIDDVSDIANKLNQNLGDYTSDNLLTEAEKSSIRTYLTTLATEKKDIDTQYTALYANTFLVSTGKSNLKSAYDDYVSKYNTLKTTINNTLGYTSITSAHKTTLNTAFTNHDSALGVYSQRADEAINSISKKLVDDSAKEVRLEFKVTGGNNLIKNGKASKGTSYWSDNGGGINKGTSTIYATCFTTTFPSGIKGAELKLKPNTDYIYEAQIYSSVALSGTTVTPLHFWCSSSSNTGGQSQCTINSYRQNCSANTWTKCYVQFTTGSGTIYFTPFIYYSDITSTISVTEISLREGKVETPWTQHQSEIYEGNTVIDADGVTISNGSITVKNIAGDEVLKGDSLGNLTLTGSVINGADGYASTLERGGLTFQTINERVGAIRSVVMSDNNTINGVSMGIMKNGEFLDLSYTPEDTLEAHAVFNPVLRIAKTVNELTGSFKGIQLKDETRLDIGRTLWFASTSGVPCEIFASTEDRIGIYGNEGFSLGHQTDTGYSILLRGTKTPGEKGSKLWTYAPINLGADIYMEANIDANGHSITNIGNLGSIDDKGPRISNMNAILPSGWYTFGDDCAATPTTWGVLLTFKAFTSDMCQIVHGTNNMIYFRWWANGKYTDWKSI